MACRCVSFFLKWASGVGGPLINLSLVCIPITLLPLSCLGSQKGCKQFRAGTEIYHIFFLFFFWW